MEPLSPRERRPVRLDLAALEAAAIANEQEEHNDDKDKNSNDQDNEGAVDENSSSNTQQQQQPSSSPASPALLFPKSPTTRTKATSALCAQLKQHSQARTATALRLRLLVCNLPSSPSASPPLSLSTHAAARVADVIALATAALARQRGSSVVDGGGVGEGDVGEMRWELRMAEGEGPDMDLPALSEGEKVATFGVDTFALCCVGRNNSPKATPRESTSAKSDTHETKQEEKKEDDKHQFEDDDNSIGGSVELASSPPARNMELKIVIPSSNDTTSTQANTQLIRTKHPMDGTLGEVLDKMGFSAADHVLSYGPGTSEREWEVVKENVHGTRQPRIMGIDRDKVYNLQRREGAGNSKLAQFIAKQRKHGRSRAISDVLFAGMVGAPTAAVRIVYRDGRAYTLITATQDDCVEIVARLEFLMALHAREEKLSRQVNLA
eukprot:jgi/Chlat1/6620/Chrsp482S06116